MESSLGVSCREASPRMRDKPAAARPCHTNKARMGTAQRTKPRTLRWCFSALHADVCGKANGWNGSPRVSFALCAVR